MTPYFTPDVSRSQETCWPRFHRRTLAAATTRSRTWARLSSSSTRGSLASFSACAFGADETPAARFGCPKRDVLKVACPTHNLPPAVVKGAIAPFAQKPRKTAGSGRRTEFSQTSRALFSQISPRNQLAQEITFKKVFQRPHRPFFPILPLCTKS